MKLISKKAQHIDTEFLKHSFYWRIFFHHHNNPEGYAVVRQGMNALLESISSYTPETAFENLWKENIIEELTAQTVLADYLHGKTYTNAVNYFLAHEKEHK